MSALTRSFRDKVIYQIYPKSFYDSNGDGVGDLRGVIEKVPYIASLGIDMVWFNPFFVSPGRDNGYDIANYYEVDPAMGTMEDVEELIQALAEHNIGVMFDMVLNHTSTEHEWFQRALAGEQEYQDCYIIREAPEGELPTNWVSKFGGPAWAPFGDTGKYYLHLFDPTQADLNWHNPKVREEAANIVNFWREKGVRGFRFDVINLIGKEPELESAPAGVDDRVMYTDGVHVDRFLQELNRRSFGQDPDAVTVGEMSSTSIERCIAYSKPENHELNMVFNFHHLKVDYDQGQKWSKVPADIVALKKILNEWALGMQEGGGWNALFWNNHDQPRAIDRFGDAGQGRVHTATMLAAVIHLLRGTPFVYQGEEIGMTDPRYTSIEQYVDVEARNAYHALLQAGHSEQGAFEIVHAKARDNSRTPMQWDSSKYAGFSSVQPWLEPTRQEEINVEAEQASGEILPFYQRLIELRHTMPIIAEGSYAPYALEHEQVFAYWREYEQQRLLVLANLTGEPASVQVPEAMLDATVLVHNYQDPKPAATMTLRAYETIALLK
ncbi:alpha,alpha-phosphotrehalase [Corynebacterium pseudopelargi]|uniref:Alpha,alpha-phosphotrehalase n=1 Tax=Corynebacterium pseudopelargi TaxID=2080757 RepID=A0A3G6IZ91_9CORY|nr:alpha,alpha-phosphotrehalase [Corynebacterium pseudopelargi]AZA09998.1 Trehalose-6-phosphate hydrolase [Corynebacterium pseudopelargi]